MLDWLYRHLFPFGSPYATITAQFKRLGGFFKRLFGRKNKK